MRPAKETGDAANLAPNALEISQHHHQAVVGLCNEAFGPGRFQIQRLTDVNRGRGAFSVVVRAELAHNDDAHHSISQDLGPVPGSGSATSRPTSVVAKLPVDGPNGEAAASGGAYAREALAYRSIVKRSPVRTPALYAVQQPTASSTLLLLEDLSRFRAADQIDGLAVEDALAVADSLRRLHQAWQEPDRLADLAVRRNTVAGFAPEGLERGLKALESKWAHEVSEQQRASFSRLVRARQRLVDRFEAETPTLCHGDPRADNLAFDDGGVRPLPGETSAAEAGAVILYDWQQLAVQFGEADLAWLAATSLTAPVRRALDEPLIAAYGGDMDRYRLGFALPGLAVLMLAQREFPTERARRFVSVSLQRIATAIDDLEVSALG